MKRHNSNAKAGYCNCGKLFPVNPKNYDGELDPYQEGHVQERCLRLPLVTMIIKYLMLPICSLLETPVRVLYVSDTRADICVIFV